MNYRLIKSSLLAISFTIILCAAISCGERNEKEELGAGGGGGNTTPPPVTTICAANCSAAGACGEHGGVNCPAGPDADGSVICADGYRDTSLKYQCQ